MCAFTDFSCPSKKVKKQNMVICKMDLQGDSGPLCPSSSALHVTLHVTPAPHPAGPVDPQTPSLSWLQGGGAPQGHTA